MEKWYKISQGVEYSANFNKFSMHSIYFLRNLQNEVCFLSRLENRVFRVIAANDFEECFVERIFKEIHLEILAGQHGQGQFID